MSKSLLTTLALSFVLAAGSAAAEPTECNCGPHPDKGAHGMNQKMIDELNLSEAQKQDFLALTELYLPRLRALAERGKQDRQELILASPDAPAYDELTARVSQDAGLATAESVVLLAELQSNVFALLNSEQKAKYLELRKQHIDAMEARKAEMKARFEERRANGGGGPFPAP